MPRAPMRLLFAGALCVTLGAAGSLQTEVFGSVHRSASARALDLPPADFRTLDAAALAKILDRSPQEAPLVLHRALSVGNTGAALRAVRSLPRDRQLSLQGWVDRLEREVVPTGLPVSRRLFDRQGRRLDRAIDASTAKGAAPTVALLPQSVIDAAARLPETAAVRTTLDLDLSARLQVELQRSTDALRSVASDGTIVLLSAGRSEVLAAVGASTARRRGRIVAQMGDSDGPRPEGDAALVGHDHLSQLREPASIAKLITASATYRTGRDADAEIDSMSCHGALRLGGEILYCTSIKRNLRGLDHAMAASCNVAFAELGRRIGTDRVVDEYRRFGFAIGHGADGPFGHVPIPELRARDAGDLAIGLNHVEITPLHAAAMARTMVDGVWRRPTIFLSRTGRTGSSLQPLPQTWAAADPLLTSSPEETTVVPEGALAPLQRSMLAVVEEGTASSVRPPGMRLRMKTGTGKTDGEGFHINYIGFTGEPDALSPHDIAFSIRLTGGRSSRQVRREAKDLTRRVLRVIQRWQAEQAIRHEKLRFPT